MAIATPETITEGLMVIILSDGAFVDRGRIIRYYNRIVTVKSFHLRLGKSSELAYDEEMSGWRVVFEGAHGERCVSPKGPWYNIEEG